MTPAPAILRADVSPAEIMPSLTPGRDALQIGAWVADPGDDSLARGSERIKLEPRMMKLLLRFAKEPGVVISQEQLLESVWSGVVVSTASVYQSISQLRKVLGDVDEKPQYIETVARKGYRFIASVGPVVREGPAETAASVPAVPAPVELPVPPPGSPAAEVRQSQRRLLPVAMVVTVAAALIAALTWWVSGTRDANTGTHLLPTAGLSAIVVLPFVDMSADGKEQAFCDGLTEEMSNWLAQIPTLRVVARTSAFKFRNSGQDVRTIGRELGTSHVLEGSLRRSGDQVRITVQLIDTRTGFHLWAGSFDVEGSNILQLQEQVARAVANNLELRLTATTDVRFADRRSANPEAYNLFLLGRFHFQQKTKAGNDQALALFRQSVAADPSFALAKVNLAQALLNQRFYDGRPILEIEKEARPLLVEAEKLAPNLADLFVTRGALAQELRQLDIALVDLKRGLKLNPNLLQAAAEIGRFHYTNGEPREALDYYTRALALDPLDFRMHMRRCAVLADLGQGDLASAACEKARSLRPESASAYAISGSAEYARGRIVPAIRYIEEASKRDASVPAFQGDRANMLLALGLPEKAGEVFASALANNPEGTRSIAALCEAGALAAVVKGGARGLATFVKEQNLDRATAPGVLVELARVAVLAGDHALARQFAERLQSLPQATEDYLQGAWTAREGRSFLLTSALLRSESGDQAGAERDLVTLGKLLDRISAAGVERYGVHQLRADIAIVRGDVDGALRELQRAAELGWRDVWTVQIAPHYEQARRQPEFAAFLAAISASNASAVQELFPDVKKPAKT
jgi:TolB-like protein/DNA-binding winged helix-turn-helix (wHTH) protein/Tfp pilus assembly protein PilF